MREMRRVSSEDVIGDGCEGEDEGEEGDEVDGGGEGDVVVGEGVVGMGMLAAVSCRSEKSVGRRPRGREGGQRRWRLGVEGGVLSWSWEGLLLLVSSETERRRFREERGGVCGCGWEILVAHCCGRDCFLEWALVLDVRAMGLASWG